MITRAPFDFAAVLACWRFGGTFARRLLGVFFCLLRLLFRKLLGLLFRKLFGLGLGCLFGRILCRQLRHTFDAELCDLAGSSRNRHKVKRSRAARYSSLRDVTFRRIHESVSAIEDRPRSNPSPRPRVLPR